MIVDVIGGSGFIGTRLVSRLRQREGVAVRIFDKVQTDDHADLQHQGDVRSPGDLARSLREGSVIINLAAEHRDDVSPRSLYHDVNVVGARNICEAAKAKGVTRIIFTSSVAVYGFAPIGTSELGTIAPFNDYGRTKYEAENIFRAWQVEEPERRSLVIIRPTVVFGERNRGNVFNLLRQIASGRFVMVGDGHNRKSMAYVENVAAFIEFSMQFAPGVHTFNFVDKPDFSMNDLVSSVRSLLGQAKRIPFRLPFAFGYGVGLAFDGLAALTGRKFAISAIRVKKFCANSVYSTAVDSTGYQAPVPLSEALERTVRYEFLETHADASVFHTE